jgi:iron complex transport system ATP-binding protein
MTRLLDATDITFAYAGLAALRGVSLGVDARQIVALLGPNGSGKSTLLQALLGHLPATGTMLIEGMPIVKWPPRLLARRMAYLPQNPSFEPAQHVRDVLRMGRAPYWGAFGLESTQDVRIADDIAGQLALRDLLDRPMHALSGGQRQRAFIARCLVQQPALLLLDEPDTFLDLRHQVELGRLIRSLARDHGIGVLWASHDLNQAAAFADRFVLLREGQVAAAGSADDVLRSELLSNVYGVALERIDRAGRPPMVLPSG